MTEKEFTEADVFKLMRVQENLGEAMTILRGARYTLLQLDPLFAKTDLFKHLSQAIDGLEKFFKSLKVKSLEGT